MEKQKITPCLWYDGDAEEAAALYVSVFGGSVVSSNSFGGEKPVTVAVQIAGHSMVLLNGGPMYKFSPAISMFVLCGRDEIDSLWAKITDGGGAMMPLDAYPWSERYGWGVDKFGMTWQLMVGDGAAQKIVPSFLFVGEMFGRGEEALREWVSVFDGSSVDDVQHYGAEGPAPAGSLLHADFTLRGLRFKAMDGPGEHAFTFTEAVSLIVDCRDQAEIDRYWNALTANGGSESMCGWLKDRYGVSWQITPSNIGQLLSSPAAAQELFKMRKIDIATLENAA